MQCLHSLKFSVTKKAISLHLQQLGILGCPDVDVFEALKSAIVTDTDERVQYEAAKALIRLGNKNCILY